MASASGPLHYQQLSAYDDSAHVAYARDRRGIVTRHELDDLDRVSRQVVDDATSLLARTVSSDAGPALVLQTLFAYDANNNRTSTIDPLGRVTQEIYDGLNRLTDRKLPMGVAERFTYDGANRQLLHVDGRGIEHRTTYDLTGRPVDELVAESLTNQGQPLRMVHRDYQDTGAADGLRMVVEVDAAFHSVAHITDALHREVTTQDALGQRVRTYFDATVKRVVVDRRGLRTEFDADAADRPVAQREYDLSGALAFTQSTSYDDSARTETARDRRGIATVRERDGLGRIESVTRGTAPDRQVTLSEYDEDGNLVEVTDPNGHVSASTYDGANRRISDTRGVGTSEETTTRYKLDKVGNRVEQSNPRTGTFVSHDSFDDLNRLVRSEDPLGNVTSRAYDEAGNLLCEKRPLGGDPLGRDQAAGLSVADVGVREAVSLRSEQSTRLHRPRWTLLSASGLGAGSSSDLYRGLHLYPLGSR